MTEDRPEIRVAAPEDAGGLLPLFKVFYGGYLRPDTEEAVRRHLEAAAPFDTVLLATVRGRAVGFASLRILPQIESDAPHAELSDVYVDAAYRRHGIGSALLRFAESLALRRGAPRITLVAGEDNEAARALYRAFGYEDFARAMRKPLAEDR